MDGLPPPSSPVIVCPQPGLDADSLNARAEAVREQLRAMLPGTDIVQVSASAMPGFFVVRLANGNVAYTDAEVRYLVLGVAFELGSGKALDGAFDIQPQRR